MGLAQGALGVNTFVAMVPRNPIQASANGEMLAVIVFALFLGVGLTMIDRDRAEPLMKVLDSIGHAMVAIIALVMQSLDNSLTTHYRRSWFGRRRLVATQGHGAPNPTWIPAGNAATRLLAEQ